jgi:phosphatidate cytidylyltransferase
MRAFLTRLLVAVIAIPTLLFIFYRGGEWLRALVTILLVLGILEAQKLASKAGASFALMPAVLLTLLSPWLAGHYWEELGWPVWVTLILAASAIRVVRSQDIPRTAIGVAVQIACVVWIGVGFGAFLGLREMPDNLGFWWLVLLFANLWIGDTAAYLFGVWLGKTPLSPRVSPEKTVAGSIAQIVASALVGAAFTLTQWFAAPAVLLIVASVLTGVIGQVGDLLESVLKRAAGEKDSSTLIPGHGGILDRFDSALLAAPSLYALLQVWPR